MSYAYAPPGAAAGAIAVQLPDPAEGTSAQVQLLPPTTGWVLDDAARGDCAWLRRCGVALVLLGVALLPLFNVIVGPLCIASGATMLRMFHPTFEATRAWLALRSDEPGVDASDCGRCTRGLPHIRDLLVATLVMGVVSFVAEASVTAGKSSLMLNSCDVTVHGSNNYTYSYTYMGACNERYQCNDPRNYPGYTCEPVQGALRWMWAMLLIGSLLLACAIVTTCCALSSVRRVRTHLRYVKSVAVADLEDMAAMLRHQQAALQQLEAQVRASQPVTLHL